MVETKNLWYEPQNWTAYELDWNFTYERTSAIRTIT